MRTALVAAVRLLVGIMLFVGLPLAGWGVEDIHGFLAHPARRGYILSAVVIQSVLVCCFPVARQRRGPGRNLVARQRLAVVLLQILSLGIVLVGPYCDRRNVAVFAEHELLRYFGLALFGLGIVGMSWAQAALGRQFSVQVEIQEGHELITRGPYRYLRHPRYLGGMLLMAGLALVFRSLGALVLAGLMVLVLLWRIYDEEALLRQEFGSRWEEYARRSWRLIPLVY